MENSDQSISKSIYALVLGALSFITPFVINNLGLISSLEIIGYLMCLILGMVALNVSRKSIKNNNHEVGKGLAFSGRILSIIGLLVLLLIILNEYV